MTNVETGSFWLSVAVQITVWKKKEHKRCPKCPNMHHNVIPMTTCWSSWGCCPDHVTPLQFCQRMAVNRQEDCLAQNSTISQSPSSSSLSLEVYIWKQETILIEEVGLPKVSSFDLKSLSLLYSITYLSWNQRWFGKSTWNCLIFIGKSNNKVNKGFLGVNREAYLLRRFHKSHESPFASLHFFFGNSFCKYDLEQCMWTAKMQSQLV